MDGDDGGAAGLHPTREDSRSGKGSHGENFLRGKTPLSCRTLWECILRGVSGFYGEHSYGEKDPTGRHPTRGEGFARDPMGAMSVR
jgi:hypothetical protein